MKIFSKKKTAIIHIDYLRNLFIFDITDFGLKKRI